jgi:HSP20 family protein
MFPWRLANDPAWTEFEGLSRRMDDLFTNLSGRRGARPDPLWRGARLFPLLNVTREGGGYQVTTELPGMNVKDLEIQVEGDTITLKGERKSADLGTDVSFHRRERTSGTFQRSLTLPHRIDSEKVAANYKDGVLTVTLPIEEAAMPKQIAVTSD